MQKLFIIFMTALWQVASFLVGLPSLAWRSIEQIFSDSQTQPPPERRIVAPQGIHDPATAKPSYVYRDTQAGVTVTAQLGNDEINTQEKKAYLLVTLTADELARKPAYQRKPLNIALVVDRSGSMAGEKLSSVKQALQDMESYLSSEDRVSLVAYDDEVETLLEPQAYDREVFLSAISRIESDGSTNLEGGLRQGLDYVSTLSDAAYTNRVILLSDGLANVGIDDPAGLAAIVNKAEYEGINVSTIGVGADYDEQLMTRVASAGRGNYYFMEAPRQAAEIFGQEFDNLTQMVAENIEVEFNFNHGVKVVQGIGYEFNGTNGFLPYDLSAGQERSYLFELDYLGGNSARGVVDLANLEINFTSRADGQRHSINLPMVANLVAHQLNPLADDLVYQQFMDAYIAEEMWLVYEELDAHNNQVADKELDEVYDNVNQANVRLEGKLEVQIKEIETKQKFVDELKDENVNATSRGRVFQKSVQSESYNSVYNK